MGIHIAAVWYCTSPFGQLQSLTDMRRESELTVAAEPFTGDPADATASRGSSWSPALVIAAALIFAASIFLTIPQLSKGELDLDEAGTFLVSTRPLADVLTVPTTWHSQPPLFYLALRAVAMQDDNEPALRILPWVFMFALGASMLLWAGELSPIARVVAVGILLLSDYGRYITVEVRPYSMAALFSCWSCLFFWRLATAPNAKRLAGYVLLTCLMDYTVAVASWIVAAQLTAAAMIIVYDARRVGPRRALEKRRLLVAGLVISGLIYLPYLVIVWMLQSAVGHPSALAALREGLNPRYFVSGPMYLTRTAYGIGFLAIAAAAYAAWDGFRRRDLFIGFLIFVVAVQISLSHGFLAGRSAFAFRYLAPAYPALCMLVGIGTYAVMRHFRLGELTLVGAAAAILLAAIVSFPKASSREREAPWRRLRADLVKLPGQKVVFFDVGWDGQRLQYETRHDPSVSVMTDPGTGWATGGIYLSPDYVRRVIRQRAPQTSMFFYQFDSVYRRSTYDSAFVPEMQRLRCVKQYLRDVPSYTRIADNQLKAATVVGYVCHAA
jgi:hypothetical protein